MPNYSAAILNGHFQSCDNGATAQIRGRAFEDLAEYLFTTVPGVPFAKRNDLNVFNNEEIDLAIWNDKARHGFTFFPNIVLIECKNWSRPVSSNEVSWFCQKLQNRSLKYGILIANLGITGDPADITAAHHTLAMHLSQGRTVIILTRAEINTLRTTGQLVQMIQQKLCKIAVGGSLF